VGNKRASTGRFTLNKDILIEGQNITLVYDNLDLREIDPGILKRKLSQATTVVDTPQLIAVVDPTVPFFIQFADNRIRLTIQKKPYDPDTFGKFGSNNIWNLAFESNKFAEKQKRQLVAYGFNYDVVSKNGEGDYIQSLNKKFFIDVDGVKNILGVEDVLILPRLKFMHEDVQYDLRLEPINEADLKAHLNAHFAVNKFPNVKNLRNHFVRNFGYLLEQLEKLGLIG
jgi:hypothetical protein